MQQVQTRAVERESAEEEYFLTVQIWAYGEEPYDCHLKLKWQKDGALSDSTYTG